MNKQGGRRNAALITRLRPAFYRSVPYQSESVGWTSLSRWKKRHRGEHAR